MSCLSVQNVYHAFFTRQEAALILANISLDIEEGEFVSFLGPSGCGKTTLLSILSGLLKPIEGVVLLEGTQIEDTAAGIGYMLQQDYLFPWKTIEDNILIGLKTMGLYTEQTHKKSLYLLAQVGLKGVEKHYPRQLSGGMRQRASLVRTLTTDPKILLLDEPFSALDYHTKMKLEELVYVLLKQYKKTSVLVTHDIEEAIAMSDRIVLLHAKPGRIANIITVPKEIRTLSPFQARAHPEFTKLFQVVWKEFEKLELQES
ncbi:ABC transporter ATP-binding protein [Bacillus sp. 165]|uniref:ABC transporter ATP-binding protein n=1 Tax=Bacillus sp. 165 TaxID=1529117 RepID=UPI001AD9CF55|nr:ABC transporter ATP-binding protein [Bacillus sp. 165]MBO9130918.1 ABC transporter ATP-binding protein [Bacillus sp. 165]